MTNLEGPRAAVRGSARSRLQGRAAGRSSVIRCIDASRCAPTRSGSSAFQFRPRGRIALGLLERLHVERTNLPDAAWKRALAVICHQHLVEPHEHAAGLVGEGDRRSPGQVGARTDVEQIGRPRSCPQGQRGRAQRRPAADTAEVVEAVDRIAGVGAMQRQTLDIARARAGGAHMRRKKRSGQQKQALHRTINPQKYATTLIHAGNGPQGRW